MRCLPVCFLMLVFCPKSVVAQETSIPPVGEQARRLLQDAALALNQGKAEVVLEKGIQVAQLMPDDSRVQQRVAELLYRSGAVHESLKYFDRAMELAPSQAAENWQRGIALATAGIFDQAAEQFEMHHRVNPDDVENSAWHFYCVSKDRGIDAARDALLPSRGDSRKPMMSILAMFRREKSEEEFQKELQSESFGTNERPAALFYGNLYLGLYYEAQGRSGEAEKFLQKSAESDIAGYMPDVARVFLKNRVNNSDRNAGDGHP